MVITQPSASTVQKNLVALFAAGIIAFHGEVCPPVDVVDVHCLTVLDLASNSCSGSERVLGHANEVADGQYAATGRGLANRR
jgi:hypothetical protein